MKEVELLAPVGNKENYLAALEAGADAFYAGAPGQNARQLSKDLGFEELGAMIDHCHGLGKKFYIAANSLVLEKELGGTIKNLAFLEELAPDALIVQDLGLVQLAQRYFPSLPLHASTLMTAHNSAGVDFLASLGLERVVLARELTLKEVATISQRSPGTELEIFVHGAMCFSYSGLCLFSSYLGGKSGLRGRCVQPCRRGYSQGKKERGAGAKRRRYLFSMNDLNALESIDALRELGVSSIKIEGRLRSAHYVRSVVAAYRLVLDAPKEKAKKSLREAQILVEEAMGRKSFTGFFISPQPKTAIIPSQSGNLGLHLGRFTSVKIRDGVPVCRFTTEHPLAVGDRLRLHFEPSGERSAFRLGTLFCEGKEVAEAPSGMRVSIALPQETTAPPRGHVEVYKVDGTAVFAKDFLSENIREKEKELAVKGKRLRGRYSEITGWETKNSDKEPPRLTLQASARGKGQGGNRPKASKKLGIEWWLKTDSLEMLSTAPVFLPDRYLLPFTRQLLANTGRIKTLLGKRSRHAVWALPPVIMENELGRVKKSLKILIASGFRNFQLGHISQKELFGEEKISLFGDSTLNLINSSSLLFCKEQGLKGSLASMELDRDALIRLLAGKSAKANALQLGVYVYGAPPLFTTRLDLDFFDYGKTLLSPKNEPCVIRRKDGLTMVYPEQPFSLLPYLTELAGLGVDYAVVDVCGLTGRRQLAELGDRLQQKGNYKKLPTFNYLGSLQ